MLSRFSGLYKKLIQVYRRKKNTDLKCMKEVEYITFHANVTKTYDKIKLFFYTSWKGILIKNHNNTREKKRLMRSQKTELLERNAELLRAFVKAFSSLSDDSNFSNASSHWRPFSSYSMLNGSFAENVSGCLSPRKNDLVQFSIFFQI